MQVARSVVGDVHRRLWERDDLALLLPELQTRTYDLARASVPLMQVALDRCRALARTDPVAAGLVDYLVEHIDEERDHDEWLLADLAELGIPRERVLDRSPGTTAARLVGAQYYWIRHDHPVALLGYMFALEGGVPTEEFVEDVLARTGLPPEGLATWMHHARVDPEHGDDIGRIVDTLPLTARQQSLIGLSALHTVELLAQLTAEVLAGAPEARRSPGTEGPPP